MKIKQIHIKNKTFKKKNIRKKFLKTLCACVRYIKDDQDIRELCRKNLKN